MKNDLAFFLLFLSVLSIGVLGTNAQAPHGTASEETPRGAIDGVNSSFTLNFQPAPFSSIHVYRNGLRQQRNLDYLLTGPNHMQIVFQPIPVQPPGTIPMVVPQPGDSLLADYTY